jgi:ATP-binding cassette, subfamily B (MDR/TAP), member 1
MSVRSTVYQSVISKKMLWFDLHLGAAEQQAVAKNPQDPLELVVLWQNSLGLFFVLASDLETYFSSVRVASSLASGMLLQYLTTCIACLVLAFMRSWSLH